MRVEDSSRCVSVDCTRTTCAALSAGQLRSAPQFVHNPRNLALISAAGMLSDTATGCDRSPRHVS